MPTPPPRVPGRAAGPDPFSGGGEMGAAMAAVDWEATPLGSLRDWPQSRWNCSGRCPHGNQRGTP